MKFEFAPSNYITYYIYTPCLGAILINMTSEPGIIDTSFKHYEEDVIIMVVPDLDFAMEKPTCTSMFASPFARNLLPAEDYPLWSIEISDDSEDSNPEEYDTEPTDNNN